MLFAICDDDIEVYHLIKKYVQDYCSRKNCEIELQYYSSANELLCSPFDYGVLFLDIMLENGIDGIEIGIRLRKMGNRALYIIVTSRTDKYVDAFEATVFRYIVKPFRQNDIDRILDEAIEYLGNAKRTFAITFRNKTDIINISDIVLIESYMRKRYVYTKNHKYQLTKPLSEIVNELKHELCFYQLQNSFLINFAHVDTNTRAYVLMDNGYKINIQKGRYEDFQINFNKYLASLM